MDMNEWVKSKHSSNKTDQMTRTKTHQAMALSDNIFNCKKKKKTDVKHTVDSWKHKILPVT